MKNLNLKISLSDKEYKVMQAHIAQDVFEDELDFDIQIGSPAHDAIIRKVTKDQVIAELESQANFETYRANNPSVEYLFTEITLNHLGK